MVKYLLTIFGVLINFQEVHSNVSRRIFKSISEVFKWLFFLSHTVIRITKKNIINTHLGLSLLAVKISLNYLNPPTNRLHSSIMCLIRHL